MNPANVYKAPSLRVAGLERVIASGEVCPDLMRAGIDGHCWHNARLCPTSPKGRYPRKEHPLLVIRETKTRGLRLYFACD